MLGLLNFRVQKNMSVNRDACTSLFESWQCVCARALSFCDVQARHFIGSSLWVLPFAVVDHRNGNKWQGHYAS